MKELIAMIQVYISMEFSGGDDCGQFEFYESWWDNVHMWDEKGILLDVVIWVARVHPRLEFSI